MRQKKSFFDLTILISETIFLEPQLEHISLPPRALSAINVLEPQFWHLLPGIVNYLICYQEKIMVFAFFQRSLKVP